jgi:hypothetical protein
MCHLIHQLTELFAVEKHLNRPLKSSNNITYANIRSSAAVVRFGTYSDRS